MKRVTVTVARADFPIDIPMTVNLSGDKSSLYFFVQPGRPDDRGSGEGRPAAKTVGTERREREEPAPGEPEDEAVVGRLRFVENMGMTPAVLKRHVESPATTVVETRDHWDTKKWVKAEK